MDQQKLAALLQETRVPDTQRIKSITAELQKYYDAHPESLLLLVELIATHGDADVRQQAAVQALRNAPQHWIKISAEQKPAVRQHLMQATLNEQNAKCRHAHSRLIAFIASVDFENKEWPEILPALFDMVNSSEISQREVGSYIVFTLLEDNPTFFSDRLLKLLEVFSKTIRDPQSADVRINTMMGIGAMMMLFEPEEDESPVKALHSIIPSMVDVLKDAVQSNDEEKVGQAFDVFQQFLAYESALLGPYLKDLVQLMLDLAANKEADDDVRSQALAFLAQAVRYRRMKIQGMPDMGQQLTLNSLLILTELDDNEDDEDMSPARSALALLDQLATDLPPRQVIVPLLDAFSKFAISDDAAQRKAGVLALGTVVEGAPDFVASQLKSVMPSILQLLNDGDAGVRHAALVAVSQIADDVAEELASYHHDLMGALVKNLQAAVSARSDAAASDPKLARKYVEIIRSVCAALDSLSDGLNADTMRQYAGELVDMIGALLSHEDYKVKIAASGALGAIAEALREEFKPYFERTMHALANYLTVKESEEALSLRSGVTDAVGRMASAVGREAFQPFVLDLMKASEEGLHLDNARLKESSFILWSSLARVYEKEFAPFLPGVFKALFESLELEEEEITVSLTEEEKAIVGSGEAMITAGKKIKIRNATEAEVEVEDGMDEDEDGDDWDDIGASSEALEKEVAAEVLGDIITHSCSAEEIKQYLEKAVEMVAPLAEHTYEGCRKAAIDTLWRSYARVWQLYEEETGTSWEPGFPLRQSPTPTLVKLGEIVTKATLQLWAEESDRDVVTEINRNVAATLKACGPAILAQQDMVTQVVSVLGTIITRSHPCQRDLGDEDESQEVEGSSEYDWLAIDTALDVVIGLAIALGPAFAELWKVFEKPIMKFGSSNEDIERSTSVGVIAECAASMKDNVTPYTEKLLTLLMKRLSDTDKETRSNAAYAAGQLIFHSKAANVYLPLYDTILRKLEPMLQVDEARSKDNASGCICRMIMAHPEQVPIHEVLPVLVNLLPLKADYEENAPVYECIYKLYENNEPTVQQLTPKLIPAFEQVLSPPTEQLEDETRQLLHRIVQILHQSKSDLFNDHQGLLKLAGIV